MKFSSFLITLLLLTQTLSGWSQINQKNKVFIDAYYGFPNLIGHTLKNKVRAYTEILRIDIGGNGPYGGKVEYMFHDQIGIGLDVNTSAAHIVFDGIDELDYERHYEITRKVLRIFPRISFHFLRHEKLDLFSGLGLGYNGSKWQFKTDDPNFDNREFSAIIPVSFRFFIGSRYFFTNYLGINFEVGIGGGGLLQGGLSFRI